jgi:hypothetical protein
LNTGPKLEGVREGEGGREREGEEESRGGEGGREREIEGGRREGETSIRESSGPQPLSKRLHHSHPKGVKHVYGGDAVARQLVCL